MKIDVPRTQVKRLSNDQYAAQCGLVAKLLDTLAWRHNGLGLLQAYVYENYPSPNHSGTQVELRVHLWHVSLVRPGIEDSGLLHDHRFDLRSSVLVGKLTNVEYELTPDDVGDYVTHSVVPARKAFAMSGEHDGLVELQPGRYHADVMKVPIGPGECYEFPKFQFHGTRVETELCVTLVQKTNQEGAQARILAPYGKKVVHAFADPYPESTWQPVIDEARARLIDSWRRYS